MSLRPPNSDPPNSGGTLPTEGREEHEEDSANPPLSARLAEARPPGHTELSEELALLLNRAEQRLASHLTREEPSPERDSVIDEVDAVMTDDALHALEGPLEGAEDASEAREEGLRVLSSHQVQLSEAATDADDDLVRQAKADRPEAWSASKPITEREVERSAANDAPLEASAEPKTNRANAWENLEPTDPERGLKKRASPRSGHDTPRQSGSTLEQPASYTEAEPVVLPRRLGEGDVIRVLAEAIRTRLTGALAFESPPGVRRILLKDGDFTIVASGVDGESLISFLIARGDLRSQDAAGLDHRLPAFGRHAGAALIAHGLLRQDQLWPALRAHSEWLLARIIKIVSGAVQRETQIPERLAAEPSVFGGATGAEVLIDTVRRVLDPEIALRWLGGRAATVRAEPATALIAECGLSADESSALNSSLGLSLGQVEQRPPKGGSDLSGADLFSVFFTLDALGVIQVIPPRAFEPPEREPEHSLDDTARRAQILARRSLVDQGDYFAVLGVPRDATGYDIRRAYLSLRRELEPRQALSGGNADLTDDLMLILRVIQEAYELLRDRFRRERYRRAIEPVPLESPNA